MKLNISRVVILLLSLTVAGLIVVPVLADYVQTGGDAPKYVADVINVNEAPDQQEAEGDLEEFEGRIEYAPKDFLRGFEIKGETYLDANGLRGKTSYEAALDLTPTTTDAYQLVFAWANDLTRDESVVVKDFWIDMITSLNSYSGYLSCGTTTKSTTTPNYGGATSSATILDSFYIDKTTVSDLGNAGFISPDTASTTDKMGSFYSKLGDLKVQPTSTDFIIKTDEAFTCTLLPEYTASTTDFTPTGNFTGVGRGHLELFQRND